MIESGFWKASGKTENNNCTNIDSVPIQQPMHGKSDYFYRLANMTIVCNHDY